MKTYTLYLLTCLPTGESYVGSTTCTLEYRWYIHKQNAKRGNGCRLVSEAILKHGPDAFEMSVICTVDSRQKADSLERGYVKHYGTLHPHGLNLYPGGKAGYTVPEAVRELKRKALKGKARPQMAGEGNPNSRLDWTNVVAIRAAYQGGGITCLALGQQYGVGKNAVHRIVSGRGWKYPPVNLTAQPTS